MKDLLICFVTAWKKIGLLVLLFNFLIFFGNFFLPTTFTHYPWPMTFKYTPPPYSFFPILFSSLQTLRTLLPLHSFVHLPFSHVYHSITHPFPSSLLSILLASCPNPSSYYSLPILSLTAIVFIIYISSVFNHLYPYHLLSSSSLLDCSIGWTTQPF